MTSILETENAPLLKTDIPGPRSMELLRKQMEMETTTVVYPNSFPIAIKEIHGSVIEDVDGNRLIDWVSGISVLNLGYSEEITSAINKQLSLISHALEIPTETRITFMESLRKIFPSNMRGYRIMFGISGSDACETAVNIAHEVHGGKHSTVTFEGAYHGVSGGIVSATAGDKYKRTSYSNGFDVIRVPFPYNIWYKNDVGSISATLRKIMVDPEAGYERPDSVLIEPIQGEGGYIVPPPGFLKEIREFCDEFDLTMIVDEIQSGLGRTGKIWAFEWDGITPDIICIGKSIGGGVPISVIYYRDDYDKKLRSPFHMGTYRANVLAMAGGIEVMKQIPAYLERVNEDGKKLLGSFSSLGSENIVDVRGKGFMIGIELGENGKPMPQNSMTSIKHQLLKKGLMMHTCGHYGNVFRFMGALNIPNVLINNGFGIFKEVIEKKEVK